LNPSLIGSIASKVQAASWANAAIGNYFKCGKSLSLKIAGQNPLFAVIAINDNAQIRQSHHPFF
jgi:hypothetical protein